MVVSRENQTAPRQRPDTTPSRVTSIRVRVVVIVLYGSEVVMRWFTVCFPFRYTHVRPRRRHLRYIYPFTAMRKMCYGKVPHRNQMSIRSQGTLSVTQRSAAYSMKSYLRWITLRAVTELPLTRLCYSSGVRCGVGSSPRRRKAMRSTTVVGTVAAKSVRQGLSCDHR